MMILEQKRSLKVALSLLLLSSFAAMSEGNAFSVGDQQQVDHIQILKHAIKVDSKNHLRSRKLEGGANEGEGEQQGEQQQNDQQNEEQNEVNEEQEEGQQNEQENEEEQDNGEEYQEEVQYDDQYRSPQIDFFKCVALSIEPDVVDVETMLANGEIDDDQAAQLENTYITELLPDLNTQESVVFFTYGYGEGDENREVYMVSINDWIAASSGYEQTCNVLDEDDAEQAISQAPSSLKSQIEAQSNLMWYSGFNCKADGSGFKPQLFLDETCTTFSRTMNKFYPFRKAKNGSTEVTSDMTKYMIQDAGDSVTYSQYCDESEFCGNVLKDSVSFIDCEGEEAEKEEAQEEGAQDAEGEGGERRQLTTYQLEYDMASDIGDACPYIQSVFSIDQDYDFLVDDLEAIVNHWSNTVNGRQDSDRRSLVPGANEVWVYLVGILAILCIGSSLVVSRSKCQPRLMLKTSGSDTDDTVDSKREPLVIKRTLRKLPRETSDIEQSFSAIECTLSKKKQRPRRNAEQSVEKRKTKSKSKPIRQFLKKSASSMSNGISVE